MKLQPFCLYLRYLGVIFTVLLLTACRITLNPQLKSDREVLVDFTVQEPSQSKLHKIQPHLSCPQVLYDRTLTINYQDNKHNKLDYNKDTHTYSGNFTGKLIFSIIH